MGKIDAYTIQRVKEAARIENVVADFVKLRKSGARYTGICPFHDDRKDGNFMVYPKGNCFKCFVCDAKGGAVDFLMMHEHMDYPDAIRWLGRKYGIPVDDKPLDYTPPPPRPTPPPLPMLSLPMSMVDISGKHREDDLLVRWVRGVHWGAEQKERVSKMLDAYHVGYSTRRQMTIWWQVDDQQRVRTGKMMRYKEDGHRNKDARYNFDFVHSCLFRDRRIEEYDDEKQEVKQCLYGLHLLNTYPDATIGVVESEKSALLMAIAYGNLDKMIWMATGGLENISTAKLLPLMNQGRRIIFYPDRDGVKAWREKVKNLRYLQADVDTSIINDWWTAEDGEKADVADVIIRRINNS